MITCATRLIAFKRCLEPWGGATIRHDSQIVADGEVGYVFSVGPTMSVPEDADYQEFSEAFDKLEANYPDARYYGVFHDNRKGTIDFNPVMLVRTRAEVDAWHKAGHEMPGGAYELHTGDGYWPQGRPELYA